MADDIGTGERLRRYRRELKLPRNAASPAAKAALDRAHELRRFEIENYLAAIELRLGLSARRVRRDRLHRQEGVFRPPLVVLVATLGIVTSLAALLTAKGSKFWQRNWESHVDLLEDGIEGHLHKIVLVRDLPVSFSVSRVNERLLICLLGGWVLAFAAAAATIWWPSLLALDARTAAWW